MLAFKEPMEIVRMAIIPFFVFRESRMNASLSVGSMGLHISYTFSGLLIMGRVS